MKYIRFVYIYVCYNIFFVYYLDKFYDNKI